MAPCRHWTDARDSTTSLHPLDIATDFLKLEIAPTVYLVLCFKAQGWCPDKLPLRSYATQLLTAVIRANYKLEFRPMAAFWCHQVPNKKSMF